MTGAVVYISSNRENYKFEKLIIRDMLQKKGDLPLYSVTQSKIGDVGVSGFNFCRQLQMAVKMAEADYVISCEADCLYSPDYFTFVPKKLNTVYRNTNNYVLPYKQNAFYKKDSQTAFQVAGRKFLLKRLNFLLRDQPQWDIKMKNFPKEIGKPFLEGWEIFKTEYPCVQIKTGNGMRRQTRHGKEPFESLPYWGKASDLRRRFLCE